MSEHHLVILALALLADRFVGDPDIVWRRWPHPVVWFGRVIEAGERAFYPEDGAPEHKRRAGLMMVALMVAAAWLAGGFLSRALALFGSAGLIVELLIVAVLLAQKSLADHVRRVRDALAEGGVEAGRKAVSMIVGRDPRTLDRSGVSRAAIESLAENTSDGVVAPALAYAVFGLSGLLVYKLVNTADSMIGHKNERYLQFGWAAARLDDLLNLVPARLTGLIAAGAFAWTDGRAAAERALGVMRRDARLHRSPNAGWPEAAFAGGLDIALGGPRIYKGDRADEPFLNDAGAKTVGPDAIARALTAYDRLLWLLFGMVAALSVLL